MSARVIRLGIAGLGRAATLMLPTFLGDARVRVTAATDLRPDVVGHFAAATGARAHADVASLCGDPEVDVVYVATPHGDHLRHATLAAGAGKHVLVEKPMAVGVDECARMIEAARRAGVHLMVGHSHSFDAPVQRARALIEAGTIGRVTLVNAQYYTDFLYRLRRAEELDTAAGGGVLWSQAAHQVDIVRWLAASPVTGVRALTGAWDRERDTEGAYAALLSFASGAFASLLYSGYGHFDSDVFCDGMSELGMPKDTARYGEARRALAAARVAGRAGATGATGTAAADAEAEAKATRNRASLDAAIQQGSSIRAEALAATAGGKPPARAHEHFGVVIVSGERGDLRLTPRGVMIHGDADQRFEPLPAPKVPRREVVDELYAAVVEGMLPRHDGRWGLETVAVCAALLASAREGRDVAPQAVEGEDIRCR